MDFAPDIAMGGLAAGLDDLHDNLIAQMVAERKAALEDIKGRYELGRAGISAAARRDVGAGHDSATRDAAQTRADAAREGVTAQQEGANLRNDKTTKTSIAVAHIYANAQGGKTDDTHLNRIDTQINAGTDKAKTEYLRQFKNATDPLTGATLDASDIEEDAEGAARTQFASIAKSAARTPEDAAYIEKQHGDKKPLPWDSADQGVREDTLAGAYKAYAANPNAAPKIVDRLKKAGVPTRYLDPKAWVAVGKKKKLTPPTLIDRGLNAVGLGD